MPYPKEQAMTDLFGYTDEQYDALILSAMSKLTTGDVGEKFTSSEWFLIHELVWQEVKRRRLNRKPHSL
jgi:hypothetical protein